MPFFQWLRDEAEKHHRKALRYRDRKRKGFNLRLSIRHFKEAVRLKPNNPLFHYHLGQAYADAPLLSVLREVDTGFELGDSSALAIAELKEAIRLKPDYPEAYMILGEAYMYAGEKEKASKAFQAVKELSDNNIVKSYAEWRCKQAEQGISDNPQPDEAIRHLEQAVTYRSLHKYGEAEKELEEALKLAPDGKWLYDNLCKLGQVRIST